MSATIEHITEEALALSEEQRAQLAHTLLQSLEAAGETREIEGAWEEEVGRRATRVEEGTATGRPAEDVFRDIRAKYR